MTLKEAVESGRRYRRKGWKDFYSLVDPANGISLETAIADDWEVEEVTVTLTPSQFDEYAKKAMKQNLHWVDVVQSIRNQIFGVGK